MVIIICNNSTLISHYPFSLLYTGLHDAIHELFEDESPVQVCTTNYRKDGSAFKNLLTFGPIYDKTSGKMTHCVAILKNIGDLSSVAAPGVVLSSKVLSDV